MQWAAMTTEPVMGPQYIWEVETKKGRVTIDAKLIEENTQKLNTIKEQRQQALMPGTQEYNHMKVILPIIFIR